MVVTVITSEKSPNEWCVLWFRDEITFVLSQLPLYRVYPLWFMT